MNTKTRPDDIDHDFDDIPPGCTLIEGNFLQNTARAKKIPFGEARRKGRTPNGSVRRETVGLIIFDSDVPRFTRALDLKGIARTRTGGKK